MKMRKVLFAFVLIASCVGNLFAQGKVWLTKTGQWTLDASKATGFAVAEKTEDGMLKVEAFTLDSVKTETTHYSKYVDEPKDRIKEGLQTFWYANGTDSAVISYTRNRPNGDKVVYYPDHSVHMKISYHNGRYNGRFQIFYPNGNVRRDDTYQEGKLMKGYLYDEEGKEMKYEPFETMPRFPGGDRAFTMFLKTNVKYPKDAQQAHRQGRVIIQFVVTADGTVTQLRVARSVYPSLDAEALRVMKKMAAEYKWIPGRQDGKNVSVKYTIPIAFNLS